MFDRARDKRAERRELRSERRRRSKEAAEHLLDLVDEGAAMFDGKYEHASGPGQEEVRDIVRQIQRKALALDDEVAREAMSAVADCFFHSHAIEVIDGDRPSQIAWNVRREAQRVLGALLRDPDTPGETSQVLEGYSASIKDHYSQYDDG
jgi:hypothetical protein